VTIYALYTLFVIAATLWVGYQYADSLKANKALIPLEYAFVLLAIAVVLILSYLVSRLTDASWQPAGAALGGIILIYYLAGSAMVRLRGSVDRPGKTGSMVTVAGVALAIIGIVLLGVSPGSEADDGPRIATIATYVTLGVAFLLLIPVGVALLSEWGIRRIGESRKSGRRNALLAAAAGVAVFSGITAVVYAATNSTWLVVALVAAALFIVALVSQTQADIAAIIGVLALGGVTPIPAELPTTRNSAPVLVALGDSYMSGEGAGTYYDGTDEGGKNQCRRSPTAWAAIAGQRHPYGQLAFLACSGARTENVRHAAGQSDDDLPSPKAQEDTGTQLDAFAKSDHRAMGGQDLVVISLGGNDAGFSTIASMCVAPGNCDEKKVSWLQGLQDVRTALRATYAQIAAAFPKTPVAVVPYPDPIKPTGECRKNVALSYSERGFIREFLFGLNKTIEQEARQRGFSYVAPMQQALADAHLQLCDDLNKGRPGLNFIGLRSVAGAAEQRFNPKNWWHSSMHPNERGHAAMLTSFESWLETNRGTLRPPSPSSDSIPSNTSSVLTADPPCNPLDPSPKGCRAEGTAWAKGQVKTFLLTQGVVAVLALAGAWVAAVALLGLASLRAGMPQAPPKVRWPTLKKRRSPKPVVSDPEDAAGRAPGDDGTSQAASGN
jgi:lysophospholipase L1-like esterase